MSGRGAASVLAGLLPVTLGVLAPLGAGIGLAASAVVVLVLSVLGGFVTARLSPRRPMHHVAILAALAAFLSVVTLLSASGASEPGPAVLLLAALVGVGAGGVAGKRARSA